MVPLDSPLDYEFERGAPSSKKKGLPQPRHRTDKNLMAMANRNVDQKREPELLKSLKNKLEKNWKGITPEAEEKVQRG